jgi:hypothetical protein
MPARIHVRTAAAHQAWMAGAAGTGAAPAAAGAPVSDVLAQADAAPVQTTGVTE